MKIPTKEDQLIIAGQCGQRFLAARLAAGLSQLDAARQLGYSNSTKLSKIETGGHSSQIAIWVIRRASELYNVSCSYLLCATEDKEGVDTRKVKELLAEIHSADTHQINSLLHEAESDRLALYNSICQLSRVMQRFECHTPHLLGLASLSNAVSAVTVAMNDYQKAAPVQKVFTQDLNQAARAFV